MESFLLETMQCVIAEVLINAVAVDPDPEADFKSQCPLKNEEIS